MSSSLDGDPPGLRGHELRRAWRCARCSVTGYPPSARRFPTVLYRRVAGWGTWFCLECDPGRPPIRIPQVSERVRVAAMNDEMSRPELMGCEGVVYELDGDGGCANTPEDPLIGVLFGTSHRWHLWKKELVPLADLDLTSSRARLLSALSQGGFLVSPIAKSAEPGSAGSRP